MTPAVLDANVPASGFVRANPTAPPVQLIDAWVAGAFTLIVSEPLLDETERTLAKPYFAARLTAARRAAIIALLRTEALVTPLTVEVAGVATHAEDDLVLAAAVSAGAEYLVTGDSRLLRLGTYEGVTLVSPRQFLELLTAEER